MDFGKKRKIRKGGNFMRAVGVVRAYFLRYTGRTYASKTVF
jgi:hypothetical protein